MRRTATLGIIAGGGPLPARVAAAAESAGRRVFVVALRGFADLAALAPFPHREIRMGAGGEILSALREHGCEDLVLIGPVRRPTLSDLRPDGDGARILARIGRQFFTGDDGLLASVVRILGEEGFTVIGAHEVLTEAVGTVGVMGRHAPDEQAWADIKRGAAVVRALGSVDVGQGCVVQAGAVLAVEAVEGTDAMMARSATLARIGRQFFTGDDGLLASVVRILGEEGFTVIGAHEVLTEAVGTVGVMGRHAPDEQAWADIRRGAAVVRALGSVDVGQGCVVQAGAVLAVEAVEGTDAMMARSATLAQPGPGGVLVKLVKPGQDRRADLPTIGPATLRNAASAGLRGVAFEAGGTLLTDRQGCIDAADAAGLFLIGIRADTAGNNWEHAR